MPATDVRRSRLPARRAGPGTGREPARRDSAIDPLTPMWRGALLYRVATLFFVVGVHLVYVRDYAHPTLGWVLVGLIVAWTAVTVAAFSVDAGRRWWFALTDLVVVLALMFSTLAVQTPEQVYGPTPTITTLWTSAPVVTVAILGGARIGAAAGAVVAVSSILLNDHVTVSIARDSALLLLAGLVLGLVAETARRAHAAMAVALRAEAVLAERERLARAVHDSVLQVLAYVRREGTLLGGPAAELAQLAGDQEVALRTLVFAPAPDALTGDVDLRALLQAQATSAVSVAVPATPVLLPAAVAGELAAVARAALSNTAVHAGAEARSWILLEDLGDEVVLSVRDDGVGIDTGRLEQAEREGRRGVSSSILGRVAELEGTAVLETASGAGTEWEVRIPRAGKGGRG